MAQIRRRTVLAMGGSAALGAVIGGAGVGAVMSRGTPAAPRPQVPAERATFEAWRRSRRSPYYIGHRGAGDVAPEHTLPSYESALQWGAQVLEISVVRSADGQLYCLHDLTLDRTTNQRGLAAQKTAAVLAGTRVTVPRLGPRWVGPNAPTMPKLSDVLATVGGRAVLCIEAKDDSAYPLMIKAIEAAGLGDTVMIKVLASSSRLAQAQKADYPVFAYLGSPELTTKKSVAKLGARLNPDRDALILPSRTAEGLLPGDLVTRAVDTGAAVWAAPVHRRHEVKYFSRLGVQGFVTPDLGYLTGAEPIRKVDNWAAGGISPGELTVDPYSNTYALQWPEDGVIGLQFADRPSFITLGQFCPVQSESYRLSFDATFDPLPTDTWQHVSVAFGHADDRYYEHRSANADGFHALLRADGGMGVYAHVEGDPNGQPLGPQRRSTPFRAGLWSRLTLDVTPDLIRWSRDDGTSIEVKDGRFRGGYLHVGRSGTDGMLKIRNMTVT